MGLTISSYLADKYLIDTSSIEDSNDFFFNKDINKNTTDEINITENNDINNKNKQKVSSYMKFYLLKKKFMKQTFNHNSYKIDKPLTYEEYIIN